MQKPLKKLMKFTALLAMMSFLAGCQKKVIIKPARVQEGFCKIYKPLIVYDSFKEIMKIVATEFPDEIDTILGNNRVWAELCPKEYKKIQQELDISNQRKNNN